MSLIRLKSNGAKNLFIERIPVDAVGVEERTQYFCKRSIKKESKMRALIQIIKMIDLTTLEGADTSGKVEQLCARALSPVDGELKNVFLNHFNTYDYFPQVAAVCVYPSFVKEAAARLKGSGVQVASVATAFPAGQLPLKLKKADVEFAIKSGADEIDMVIDRDAFLSGDYQKVFDEIVCIKEICGQVHLKVILETGELKTYDKIRLASHLAMEAGADFIKTSTGKVSPGATLGSTLVMLQAIQDYYDQTGQIVGMKPAGGIRTAKQAIQYLVMLNETLGKAWMTPELFRFGASTLLNDVLRQIFKQLTGRYYYHEAFSID